MLVIPLKPITIVYSAKNINKTAHNSENAIRLARNFQPTQLFAVFENSNSIYWILKCPKRMVMDIAK